MREYELTVLLHPDLEVDLEKPLKKLRKLITDNKGEIKNEDNWGKRRMAYRVNGEDFAVYVCFTIDLEPSNVKKIDTTLNITDEVMRHLLVSVDPKAKAALEEQKKRDSEKAEESEE